MAANKSNYIDRQLTWDQAVDLFPDRWVIFKDCVREDIDFKCGTLVDVIPDEDMEEYMSEHFNDNYFMARTTEGFSGGYIHCEIKEKVAEQV